MPATLHIASLTPRRLLRAAPLMRRPSASVISRTSSSQACPAMRGRPSPLTAWSRHAIGSGDDGRELPARLRRGSGGRRARGGGTAQAGLPGRSTDGRDRHQRAPSSECIESAHRSRRRSVGIRCAHRDQRTPLRALLELVHDPEHRTDHPRIRRRLLFAADRRDKRPFSAKAYRTHHSGSPRRWYRQGGRGAVTPLESQNFMNRIFVPASWRSCLAGCWCRRTRGKAKRRSRCNEAAASPRTTASDLLRSRLKTAKGRAYHPSEVVRPGSDVRWGGDLAGFC